jgi:dienelactone hydrolase
MSKNDPVIILIFFFASCSYLPELDRVHPEVEINETRNYLQIDPVGAYVAGTTGLIFYPGGLVDPHAYVDFLSAFALSGSGHRILIVKMPANLAILDIKAARDILKDQADRDWVIAGHSLGGAMACSMVDAEHELFKGLILMAAYPAESVDLSGWDHPLLSVMASEDQVVDWNKYEEGKTRLPQSTQYEIIEGGNHAGFGQYGEQKGDGTASTSQTEQHDRIVELMQNFFSDNGMD